MSTFLKAALINELLEKYNEHGLTTTEAMLVLHIINAGNETVPVYAARMGLSQSAVRTNIRSLERKGMLARRPQLGGANRLVLVGPLAEYQKEAELCERSQ